MSEVKFTPGPWKISEYRNGHSMIIEGSNESDTAEVGYPNRDANAHLIAAAPQLYSALEICAELLRTYEAHHLNKGDEAKAKRTREYAEMAESVLTRARGEG